MSNINQFIQSNTNLPDDKLFSELLNNYEGYQKLFAYLELPELPACDLLYAKSRILIKKIKENNGNDVLKRIKEEYLVHSEYASLEPIFNEMKNPKYLVQFYKDEDEINANFIFKFTCPTGDRYSIELATYCGIEHMETNNDDWEEYTNFNIVIEIKKNREEAIKYERATPEYVEVIQTIMKAFSFYPISKKNIENFNQLLLKTVCLKTRYCNSQYYREIGFNSVSERFQIINIPSHNPYNEYIGTNNNVKVELSKSQLKKQKKQEKQELKNSPLYSDSDECGSNDGCLDSENEHWDIESNYNDEE